MYERVVQAQARQSVALEVLAYHAVAPNNQVYALQVGLWLSFNGHFVTEIYKSTPRVYASR